MNAIKYQIIKVNVPNQGAIVNINVNSDKLYKRITGIVITAPYTVPFLNMSTISLQINDKEIFPDDFEVKLLTSDQAVSVNDRFYLLDEVADGSTIKGKYKDGNLNVVCYPYTANIYLKLEEKHF
ncbi:MAG TPA: hypothetical protein VIH57_23810 [Bacteroidales bacterium]